ncbi:MAG TPA: cation:proton antiporter [Gemmatimonadaceae bacterium]|nr:cation:proton antiporter [Gemmatimonadaceae bacterium]
MAILGDLVLLFALGAAGVLAMHRLHLPPIVGYMAIGVLIGPHAFGVISAPDDVQALAEVGVVLLLFTIGLQFSFDDLLELRRTVLVGGTLQILGTAALVAVAAILAGTAWRPAVFLGLVVAHSSSTLILRLLSDRGELDALHGRAALGVSLFQDLSVVPMMLAVPLLAQTDQSAGFVLTTLLKVVLFVGTALVAARVVIPRILTRVVRAGRREAFLLALMALCFGAAWASAAAGLSLAVGAFIAGLLISESPYGAHALGEVLPLREIFVSLFFISIGMLVDPRALAGAIGPALMLLGLVIAIKLTVATAALLAAGQSARTAAQSGLLLAQVGEFAFVLAVAGAAAALIDPDRMQLVLTVAVGSMLVVPLAMPEAERLAVLLGRALHLAQPRHAAGRETPLLLRDHVVVVGLGVNGRMHAHVLARHGVRCVAVEVNPERVRRERARDLTVVFGDATRMEVLAAAGMARAAALVVAISDVAGTRACVAAARRLNHHARILVRSRYGFEAAPLLALGADDVVVEEIEAGIELFSRLLEHLGASPEAIASTARDVRERGLEGDEVPLHSDDQVERATPDTADRSPRRASP